MLCFPALDQAPKQVEKTPCWPLELEASREHQSEWASAFDPCQDVHARKPKQELVLVDRARRPRSCSVLSLHVQGTRACARGSPFLP